VLPEALASPDTSCADAAAGIASIAVAARGANINAATLFFVFMLLSPN
jgi:hypothetical protein